MDHVFAGDSERVGDLHEASEAGAEVAGRFVPLDRLLLHADPLGELTGEVRLGVTPLVQSVDNEANFHLGQWVIAWHRFASRPGLVPAPVRRGN
jgi:hypothetical protein